MAKTSEKSSTLFTQKKIASLSDLQLMQQYRQSGDTKLVGELYRRYHHLAFGACLKVLKNKEESSDLVVVIFEKIIVRLKTEEVYNFNSWLYSLCKNECVSYIRKQHAQRNRQEVWEENEKKSEIFMENEELLRLCEKEIAEEPVEDQQEAQVRAALKQLPRAQKICIQLFFYQQKSYQQIADKTDFSLLQVKSYLQNGKRNLKKLLQEET